MPFCIKINETAAKKCSHIKDICTFIQKIKHAWKDKKMFKGGNFLKTGI